MDRPKHVDRPFLTAVQLMREKVASFLEYPFNVPAISSLHTLELHPSVTFLVGENGTGKSTLLEAIAVALGLNAEGGSRNFNFSTRPSQSALADYVRLHRTLRRPRDAWFLRAESFFNVATEIEALDAQGVGAPRIVDAYGGKSLHEQSHGEAFFSLFRERFGGGGLYLLDEPEAAMSPSRLLAFLGIMQQLVHAGSQFIIATHSPILITYPDSWTYVLGPHAIERTPAEQTEHFRVTRDFLNHPGRMLSILLENSPSIGDDTSRDDVTK